ncbi:MAG: hypothetical protein NC302_06155 [Bacteroidales bacterium]|nr:hypothetical protein [Bacteroidales bacterium]MCM1415883.1 hypothetical protein [bacterium]MCM1422687.1 hypothetical protein [bacterium]
MRMTNKIMRNNSAYNINQNKILQDKLTNQMTNQSKIVRPSDDPVVAIRALRLRSNVSAVTQYNEKNAEDAKQWLTLTADAMNTVDEVLTDLYKQCTTSADKYETADDLRILLSQMKQDTAEFYSCANVDYAGRYVFSGYRTDMPVTFTKEDEKQMDLYPVSYNINESFGFNDISRISYTNYDRLGEEMTGTNTVTGQPNPAYPLNVNSTHSYEQTVFNDTLYRFRISYNNLDSLESGSKLTFSLPGMPAGEHIQVSMTPGTGGAPATTNVDVVDDDGNVIATPSTGTGSFPAVPDVQEFADQETAYQAISAGTCKGIAFIPSTGELVFSKDFFDANLSEAVFNGEDSFHVNYDKSSWLNGEINPVHYFSCTETKTISAQGVNPPETKVTRYNFMRDSMDQDIYYDVGYNQQIQVNTCANEIFVHDVQRDMDDFDHYLKQLEDIERVQKNLEEKLADYPTDSDQYKDLQERIEGAKKARTYIRENVHTKFENQITKYQKYMDDSRVAMTDNATRGSRLELVKARLTNQQATFKELQQDNEGIDITEVAVELTSAELTYNAALMATGKIMQTNLMNYI